MHHAGEKFFRADCIASALMAECCVEIFGQIVMQIMQGYATLCSLTLGSQLSPFGSPLSPLGAQDRDFFRVASCKIRVGKWLRF
jgi:hypothetical protein